MLARSITTDLPYISVITQRTDLVDDALDKLAVTSATLSGTADTNGKASALFVTPAGGISRFAATSQFINLDRTAQTSDRVLEQLAITNPSYLADRVNLAVDL